jgi:hypothetical protein
MHCTRVLAGALVILGFSFTASAESLAVGDAFPLATLEDQFGVEHILDASVAVVLFSRDMDGGAVMREMLQEESLGEPPLVFLGRIRAVCVADVHRMPGLIRRAIAKPRMRKRPYPLLLDESGEPTAAWPSAEKQTTLIRLREGRIAEVADFADVAALRAALGAPVGD